MFDCNQFKKSIKQWIRENPQGSLTELTDYCEDLIPSQHYASNNWLVDQTVNWYKHVLSHRETANQYRDDDRD